jgi:AcrR family transcriptional regulator
MAVASVVKVLREAVETAVASAANASLVALSNDQRSKKQRLVDAAVEVFGNKGYGSTTVDEIAATAHVSKGIFFYHFKTKADLAAFILEDGIASFAKNLEKAVVNKPDAIAALREMTQVFAQTIVDNPSFTRFLIAELWREDRVWSVEIQGATKGMTGLIKGQLERGQREGSIREDSDPQFSAMAIFGICLTSALDLTTYHQEDSMEAFIAHLFSFASHGIVTEQVLGLG